MMNTFEKMKLPPGKGICYSGFREGQHPGGQYPSYAQVKEDLDILKPHWDYLRLYDCDAFSRSVLEIIREHKMDFKVQLGAYIEAEMNNFNCPWGGVYAEEQLEANKTRNSAKMDTLIAWAGEFKDIICMLSVGNEACVDWNDHYVHENKVLAYARKLQDNTRQLVTFCENYAPWHIKLEKLAAGLDVISIHTYPVWEYKHIDEALGYTKENYYSVAHKYPDKPVIITEAGWATNSNGQGIDPHNVNETYQKIYFEKLISWAHEEGILTFFFEAFDEPWKGSPEPDEPEKHWGLFKEDRSPKLAMQKPVRP
ncbi:MAG: glycosyl hydrolase [Cyclonatronaceae bacterium]